MTPFAGPGIDLDALVVGAEYQLDHGVDVLCVGGAIAQMEQLRTAERVACAEAVCAMACGRLPVLATIPAEPDAPISASRLADAGVRGLLVVPVSADPGEIVDRLRAIADAVPETLLAVYHRPPLRLEPGDLWPLVGVDTFVALKDGHRDVRLFRRLRSALGSRLLWVSAWEDVAPAFCAMGAEAFCPFSAAYAPEYSRMWLAALERGRREWAEALLAAHAYPMVDLRLSRPAIDVAVVKAAMAARGLPAGESRPPATALREPERDIVERLVADLPAVLGAAPGPQAGGFV